MGIYSSGMSCWERRMAGLAQDNAGPETIGEDKAPEVKVALKTKKMVEDAVEATEVVAEPIKAEKPKGKAKNKKKAAKKSFADKLKGK